MADKNATDIQGAGNRDKPADLAAIGAAPPGSSKYCSPNLSEGDPQRAEAKTHQVRRIVRILVHPSSLAAEQRSAVQATESAGPFHSLPGRIVLEEAAPCPFSI